MVNVPLRPVLGFTYEELRHSGMAIRDHREHTDYRQQDFGPFYIIPSWTLLKF